MWPSKFTYAVWSTNQSTAEYFLLIHSIRRGRYYIYIWVMKCPAIMRHLASPGLVHYQALCNSSIFSSHSHLSACLFSQSGKVIHDLTARRVINWIVDRAAVESKWRYVTWTFLSLTCLTILNFPVWDKISNAALAVEVGVGLVWGLRLGTGLSTAAAEVDLAIAMIDIILSFL